MWYLNLSLASYKSQEQVLCRWYDDAPPATGTGPLPYQPELKPRARSSDCFTGMRFIAYFTSMVVRSVIWLSEVMFGVTTRRFPFIERIRVFWFALMSESEIDVLASFVPMKVTMVASLLGAAASSRLFSEKADISRVLPDPRPGYDELPRSSPYPPFGYPPWYDMLRPS